MKILMLDGNRCLHVVTSHGDGCLLYIGIKSSFFIGSFFKKHRFYQASEVTNHLSPQKCHNKCSLQTWKKRHYIDMYTDTSNLWLTVYFSHLTDLSKLKIYCRLSLKYSAYFPWPEFLAYCYTVCDRARGL